MSTPTTDLIRPEDLAAGGAGSRGPEGDLAEQNRDALRAVADWIASFVVRPHAELGRPGSVCPFVPTSLTRGRLWLVPERIGDGDASRVAEVLRAHQRRLLDIAAASEDQSDLDVIVVVFPDLPADRAAGVFETALEQVAVPSYVEEGTVFGPFYEGHPGTAIYNPAFRPFRSPVPFVFVRHTVVEDWKFFLGQEDWLTRWAHRHGDAAVHALAAELRGLPWNARRD